MRGAFLAGLGVALAAGLSGGFRRFEAEALSTGVRALAYVPPPRPGKGNRSFQRAAAKRRAVIRHKRAARNRS